jgi:hypothetical protein
MVEVMSEEEQNFIEDNFFRGTGRDLWTGLIRVSGRDTNIDFKWLSQKAVVFSKWATDQPNNRDRMEYCVIMSNGPKDIGSWHDVKCNIKYSVLCQKNLQCTDKREKDIDNLIQKLYHNPDRKFFNSSNALLPWFYLMLAVSGLFFGMCIMYFVSIGLLRNTNIQDQDTKRNSLKEKHPRETLDKEVINESFSP